MESFVPPGSEPRPRDMPSFLGPGPGHHRKPGKDTGSPRPSGSPLPSRAGFVLAAAAGLVCAA